MRIRKSAAIVFEAFIDPLITRNFWFTKGSDKLMVNKEVIWECEMDNVSKTVIAREIQQSEKILYDWGEPSRTVEFRLRTLSDDSTYVTVKEWGYGKSGDELLEVIKGSTAGFTTVLDGLKAYLEHGINLNLIADKSPQEVTQH